MTIFIGDISALQFLLSNGQEQRRVLGAAQGIKLTPTQAHPLPGSVPNWRRVEDLGLPDGIRTEKLHVNVADRASRSQSSLMISHVWTGPRRGTYLRIDEEYCVMTPEACFAQLAGHVPLPYLVELGMTLCGTFAPAPEGLPARYDIEPLTTPEKIRSYLEKLSGTRGLADARRAAKLLASGAGSAMESKIAASVALSTRRGGWGIPAQLNTEIELTDEARGLGFRHIRRPDFLWPKYGVAMDYDSKEYHDSAQQLQHDEERRNELAAVGLKSIVARSHHFEDLTKLEALMKQVFSAMGRVENSQVDDLDDRRIELFDQLFGEKQWRPMDEE